MSGVDELLTQGEQLQEQAHPSIKDSRYIKSYLFSGILAVAIIVAAFYPLGLGFNQMYILGLLVVPVLIAGKEEIYRRFVDYYITTEQVIMRRGILNQTTETTTYSNITDVTLNKDINERVFDVGDIRVNTAGHDGTTLVLNGLKDPERYKRMIENNVNGQNQNNGGFDNSGLGDDTGGGFGGDDAFGDDGLGDGDGFGNDGFNSDF